MNKETNLELELKVGNDLGNSDQKIIINGELIIQPNVFAKVNELPVTLDELDQEKVIEDIHNKLIVTVSSSNMKSIKKPGIYYIGNYAINSGKTIHNMEVGTDNKKIDDDLIVINPLAHIAGYVAEKAHMQGYDLNKPISVKVDMTTSLPVNQYSRKATEELQTRLKGRHNVKVQIASLCVEINIEFTFVKVLPESVAPVFALKNCIEDKEFAEIFNLKNLFTKFEEKYKFKIEKGYFDNKKILHVNIGDGTTEFPLTSGIAFDPDFIEGTNNGIGHAIEAAIPELKNRVGLRVFKRQDYAKILRDNGNKYYDFAMEYIQAPLENESEDIIRAAHNEIEKANNDVDILMVHGGGNILLEEFLEKKFDKICDRADIKLFYVPKEYTVILEVLGLFAFTKSSIFEKLKENSK